MKLVHTTRRIGVQGASYKTPILALAAAVFALTTAGCGSQKAGSSQMNNGSSASLNSADDEQEALAQLAFEQPQGRAKGLHATPAASISTWSLVLGTYTGEGHQAAAQNMVLNLRTVAPQLAAGSRVHTSGKGSMVVYGQYKGRDDTRAKADTDRIKAIQYQGRPVFNRVILAHIDESPEGQALHPHDLMSARLRYPKVDPLYTIDVALWDDFDSGKLTWSQIRANAEKQCAALRARGFDAYFYHDEVNERSMVTVGLFDRRAIHPTSGMFSDDVQVIMKQFPERLVNGEPLLEIVDPYAPRTADAKKRQTKTRPQTPKLVLVPEL